MSTERRFVEFVLLPSFETTTKGVLGEEEIRRSEEELVENPWAGDLVAHTGGVRKIRVAQEGRGTRGSARVVYLYIETRSKIYLLLAFAKNMRANLSADERVQVRRMVEMIRGES